MDFYSLPAQAVAFYRHSVISIVGIALNIYGFFFTTGAVGSAFA
jgi:hypothetical protein